MKKIRACELCNAEAVVFCPSDAAFLCCNCDAKVHGANFLVARHLRRTVCSTCDTFTGDFISGAAAPPNSCPSCAPASSSLSSTSTTSPEKEYSAGRREEEGVFVDWCGKVGLGGEAGSAVVGAACRALKACVDRWTALPFRVCLAASMWLGLRLTLHNSALTSKLLKRLHEISGVPPKIILAVHSKLERAVRARARGGHLDRRRPELQEGWAEC